MNPPYLILMCFNQSDRNENRKRASAQNDEPTGSNETELILLLRPPRTALSHDVMLNDSHSVSLSVETYRIDLQILILLVAGSGSASVFEPKNQLSFPQKLTN